MVVIIWCILVPVQSQSRKSPDNRDFTNPISIAWLKKNLRKETPRLVLTPELEEQVREKLESDPLTGECYRLLKYHADEILRQESLSYNLTGRRLLGVSREAIKRISTLALVFRIEQKEVYLRKLEEELVAVCRFDNWNPSHFLDVAEMATAVALGMDWAGEWVDPDILDLAGEALVEKALKPGMASSQSNGWIDVHHNWNLVCHGGLSLAALAMFEKEPELCSGVLHRAVDKIPLGLMPYAPDGVYPEGPSYWFYATNYLTTAVAAFESSLGTNFGFPSAPGVMESAFFSQVTAGPSGKYFNFFDASLDGYHSLNHMGLLAWFAQYSPAAFDAEDYLQMLRKELERPGGSGVSRFLALHVLFLALLPDGSDGSFTCPEAWIGRGQNPICIFRDPAGGRDAFFLAAKGGSASDNHGNMDAGSFVFELDGIRWSVDPGNQNYHQLEEIMGMELWNKKQDSRRWTLLTKNNFGHSTLSINSKMHLVDARAEMLEGDPESEVPNATFDLTPVFGEKLEKAHRKFEKTSDNLLLITDELVFNEATDEITWQLVTRAGIRIRSDHIVLEQDGKYLHLRIRSGQKYDPDIVSLSPPPLSYDKNIEGLKRLDIHFHRADFPGQSGIIEVEMSNQ